MNTDEVLGRLRRLTGITTCGAAAAVWLGGAAHPAMGVITWNITYNDVANNTNVGFDDPALGSTRQATFESALDYVNTVVDESGTVDFLVENSQTDMGGFLASAGSAYTGPIGFTGFQNGNVYRHAVTGIDPSVGNPDGSATFDFGYNWNSDLGAPLNNEVDLFSVSLHEITHALGFSSLLGSDGTSRLDGRNPGWFSVYDSYLEQEDGTPLFDTEGEFIGDPDDLINNSVVFTGTSAVLASGGTVPVYSPDPFAAGSSMSHITTSGAVMTYSISYGETKRSYLPVEIGILDDIGWTLVAIPEPSALLMMGIAVFSLVRVRSRRRCH